VTAAPTGPDPRTDAAVGRMAARSECLVCGTALDDCQVPGTGCCDQCWHDESPDERNDVHLMPAGEDGHYYGWDCYCVPPWTDAVGVRTYHHRDASYWASR
jgi:hypothetical protein